MKNLKFLTLMLLAIGLVGCKNSGQYDDDSFPPGTLPSEPADTSTTGSGSDDITSGEETGTVTGIASVSESPSIFDADEGIDLAEVSLLLNLNNGSTITRHPDRVSYDATGKVSGDNITVTAYYGDFSITFSSTLYVAIRDVLDHSLTGTTNDKDYLDWSYDSPVCNAKYSAITTGKNCMNLSTDNNRGIVSSYSGGRIKKIKVQFNTTEPETASTPSILFFLQSTPFLDKNDLANFSKTDASLQVNWQRKEFEYTPAEDANYFYFGCRAYGAVARVEYIKVYWDTEVAIPTLEEMEYTSGTAYAETNYTEWDLSQIKVQGTYSDGAVADITRFSTLSSDTPIPSVVSTEVDVSVTGSYDRDSLFVPHVANVKGNVAAAMVTHATWQYKDTVTGGALSTNLKDGSDSSGHVFYQDNKNNTEDNYLQVLSSTPYWTTSPTTITFIATLGGGSTKTFDSGYEIYVTLLGEGGTPIATSKKVVTKSITDKLGSEFTVNLVATENVYGFKMTHKQVYNGTSAYNVRYFSVTLRSIA